MNKVSHTYFPAFDVFRGIGIIFVVLAHTPRRNAVMESLRPIGVLGVHMFFAMSGFLITYRFLEELEQTGHIDLRSFYRRRVRRILPPAIIYLAVLAALGPWLHRLPATMSEIAASLLFYRNLFEAQPPNGWYTGHFWSLSLEEQFYLVWPVLFVMCGRLWSRWLAVFIIAATVVWRTHVSSVDPTANVYRPDLLADHLLWGCLIGLLWKRVLGVPAAARAAMGILGIISATFLLYRQPPFWQPLFAFSVAAGFILAAEASQSWAGKLKPLQKLGEASYDCYIWQSIFLPLPFAAMALPWEQRLPWSYFLIAAATTASFLFTFPRRGIATAPSTG
jgi:peptidoglycan/LPS O-acetylase OafA/YrhL